MNVWGLEEVCKSLKITIQTGRNRLSKGLPMPPSFRIGRRRLFIESEIEKWLIEQAGIDSGNVRHQETIVNNTPRGRPRKTHLSLSKK
ncbi:MAG: hypothetical protein NTU92_02045 [Methylotenera sp.]|nr:hypothetical protein [Methylotenera sp.]